MNIIIIIMAENGKEKDNLQEIRLHFPAMMKVLTPFNSLNVDDLCRWLWTLDQQSKVISSEWVLNTAVQAPVTSGNSFYAFYFFNHFLYSSHCRRRRIRTTTALIISLPGKRNQSRVIIIMVTPIETSVKNSTLTRLLSFHDEKREREEGSRPWDAFEKEKEKEKEMTRKGNRMLRKS